jgi:hypothetical protein
VDTDQYRKGCETLENFVVDPHGGVRRRGGLKYVNSVKDSSKATRLIPFVFSREESYVLELGHQYIRFYTDGAQVTSGKPVASTTITAGGSGYGVPPTVTFSAPTSGTTATGTATVASGAVTSITITNAGSGYTSAPTIAFSGGGGASATATLGTAVVYEIATPWSDAEVWNLHFAQANDIMYIVHSGYKPRKLSRTGAAAWTIATPSMIDAVWDANSDGHVDGFPRTVVFFEQRLWYGGRTKDPQTLWASKAAAFETFTIPASPAADDALELVLASNRQEKIEWLSSQRVLIIGTSGGEHRLIPNQYLSSGNLPLASRMSTYGGRHIQPEHMGRFTVYIQGSGRQVRTYEQRAASNIELYDSDDLSWMSEHVTTSGIISMSYQLYPYTILWCVRTDGTLLSMTADPALMDDDNFKTVAWARHTTDGLVESVVTIPNDTADETWVAVKRTNSSGTIRTIEMVDWDNAVDSSLSYSGSATASVSGLAHLEGKTVSVLADGATHPDVTVSSGAITLTRLASTIVVGLPFTSTLKTVPMESSDTETQQGLRKRWTKIIVRVISTAHPLVNGTRRPTRHPSTGMDKAEPLVTGDLVYRGEGFDDHAQIEVKQDLPLPCEITALFGDYEVNQG